MPQGKKRDVDYQVIEKKKKKQTEENKDLAFADEEEGSSISNQPG